MNNNAAKKATEPRASEIDAEAIMRQIRANIHKQRAQAEAQGQGKDFVEEPYASQVTTRFDHRLYDALQRMSDGYDKVGVGLLLTESRLPFIAPLVQRVRASLHQLIIYYVNTLAGQQARFNERVVLAIKTLVEELEKDPIPNEVESLRQEIAQLRAQIEHSKAKK